jgi:CDP-diacylglycerol pyrophosphatase
MKSLFQKLASLVVLCTLLCSCSGQNSRLQKFVTNCIDTTGEDYCAACPWPRTESSCAAAGICTKSTEVWRETENYIAIRDKKMCNCSKSGFIHGLAIPKALIAGIESSNRPNGIWKFAWETAIDQGIRPFDLALAINPSGDRSENQMHIHIARLLPGARAVFRKEQVSWAGRLDQVWSVAREIATRAGLADYGILVIQGKDIGYDVVVSASSPEHNYTVYRCSDKSEN